MRSLKIRDVQSGSVTPIESARVVFGRDDGAGVVVSGPRAGLVSAQHAELSFSPASGWTLADLGSTNGTFLNGKRVTAPQRVADGDTISLAAHGPQYVVVLPAPAKTIVDSGSDLDATVLIDDRGHEKTVPDQGPFGPEPAPDKERWTVVLRRPDGQELRAAGRTVVIGRDPECDIPLRTEADRIVSSRHAEIRFADDGTATIADCGSRNGTFVGDRRLKAPAPLAAGETVRLGEGGPELTVARLGDAAMKEVVKAAAPEAKPTRAPRASLAAMVVEARKAAKAGGTMMFAAAMAEQMAARSSKRLRWVLLGSGVAVVCVSGLIYGLAMRQVRAAARQAEEVRAALAAQIGEAVQARRRGDAEIQRLMRELENARTRSAGRAVTEGIARQVATLRSQDSLLQRSMAAIRALELPVIVQMNSEFVAAVQAGRRVASGFLISESGYLLTASAVLRADSGQPPPDTVLVFLDDEPARARVADVMLREGGTAGDVAMVRVRGYSGGGPRRLNWSSSTVRERAAVVALGVRIARGDRGAEQPGWAAVTTTGAVATSDSVAAQLQLLAYPPLLGAPVFDGSGALVGVLTRAERGGTPRATAALLRDIGSSMPEDLRAIYGVR